MLNPCVPRCSSVKAGARSFPLDLPQAKSAHPSLYSRGNFSSALGVAAKVAVLALTSLSVSIAHQRSTALARATHDAAIRSGHASQADTDTNTDHRSPTPNTEHRTPNTDHRSPITDHRSPITDHRTPITEHRSPNTDHRSPITEHRSPITDHRSPNTDHRHFQRSPITDHRHRAELRSNISWEQKPDGAMRQVA